MATTTSKRKKSKRKTAKRYTPTPRAQPWVTPKMQRLVDAAKQYGWTTEITSDEITFYRDGKSWRYLSHSKCFISTIGNDTIRSLNAFNGVINA